MVMQSNPFDQFDAPASGGGVIIPSTPAQRQMQQDEAVRSRNAAAASVVSPAQAQAELEMAELRIRELEQQIAASQVEQTAEADEQEQAQTKSSIGAVQRMRQNDEMLDRIRIAREEVARPFTTGNVFGTETFASVPFAGQNAANLRNTIEGLFGSAINDKLKELKDLSPTGSSGFGNFTEKEAERLAASIAAIQQTSTPDKLLVELDRLERNYRSARILLEMGQVGSDEEAFAEYERLAPNYGLTKQADGTFALGTMNNAQRGDVPLIEGNRALVDIVSGRDDDDAVSLFGNDDYRQGEPLRFGPGAGVDLRPGGGEEAYSTPEDLAVAKEVQYVYNEGGSLEDMVRASESFNRPVDAAKMIQFANAIAYRDGTGQYEGQNTGYSTVTPAKSGRRNALQQALGSLAATDAGRSALGSVTGAANAITFGGLDEIYGTGQSLFKGEDVSPGIKYANLVKQTIADESPRAYLLGEIGGGIGAGGIAAKLAPNLARQAVSTTGRAAATGAGVGGVTGGLEMNENRAMGVGLGAGLGAGGGVVGQRYIGPGMEGLASSPLGQSFSKLVNRGNVLPDVSDAERRIGGVVNYDMAGPAARLQQMQDLGMPAVLADADPKLRALAGAVARRDFDTGVAAREAVVDRSRGQSDRAVAAIEENFGAIRDPNELKRDLTRASTEAAQSSYNRAYSQPAPDSELLRSILQTDFGQQALNKAFRAAENEGISPTELGFVMRDDGNVDIPGMSGGGEKMPLPTVRTLDLVKRAMDEVIEDGNKNPITGLPLANLSFTARAQQNARGRFVEEIDRLVPDYKDARAASAPFLQARGAVDQGANILNRGLRPEEVVAYDRRLGDVGKDAYRLGATRALYDNVQNVSDNRNPYAAIFGRPQIRDNLNYLFPDGSRRFSQIVDAEKDMAATAQEIAGGSPTAQRMMTDQALNPENMGTGIMLDIAGGGGAVTANNLRRPIMNAVKDRVAVGVGEAGRRRASEIAPYLLDPIDPNTLQNIQLYAQQRARRRAQASQLGGLFGASFPGAVLGGE